MATDQTGLTADEDLSQDISGGKRLENDSLHRHLQNNIRSIMNSTGAAMRILDTDFNVVLENDRMKEMGGVEAEGATDLKCFDQFCNPEVCGTQNCTLKQIVDEGKEEIRVEVEKESYGGRVVPTELVSGPSATTTARSSPSARRSGTSPPGRRRRATSRVPSTTSRRPPSK